MSRKEKLEVRANNYARCHPTYEADAVVQAYLDGYRAAMRDLRKVMRETAKDVPQPAPNATFNKYVENVRRRKAVQGVAVQHWLRPLR